MQRTCQAETVTARRLQELTKVAIGGCASDDLSKRLQQLLREQPETRRITCAAYHGIDDPAWPLARAQAIQRMPCALTRDLCFARLPSIWCPMCMCALRHQRKLTLQT